MRPAPVLLRDLEVVLERLVRPLERVVELEALEEIVVLPGLVTRPVLDVHRAPDRPQGAWAALDPDADPLGRPRVVDPRELPLGEAHRGVCPLLHAGQRYNRRRRGALLLTVPQPVLLPVHPLVER